MPAWFPHSLAELVVFTPLRIIFLIIVAVLARLILHRLITRAVRTAIEREPPHSRFRAAQALAAGHRIPPARREQRISALGSLARSAVTFVIFLVAA